MLRAESITMCDLSALGLEPLSHSDAARWHMTTPANPMVIGALLEFEERLPLAALETLLTEKLPPYRRFQQRVVEPARGFSVAYWHEDGRFDASAHVGMLDTHTPITESVLVDLVSQRINAALPTDRSPWRFDLIDLASGASALFVRVHHCIADGQALVAVLEELGGRTPSVHSPHFEPRSAHTPKGLRESAHWVLNGAQALCKLVTLADDPGTSLRGSLGGEKRLAWSKAIATSTVKAIARSRGCRFTDVVLSAVAGALRQYILAHGDERSTARGLRALLPIASSPGPGLHGLGNRYASVFVDLPVDIADPLERLDAMASRVQALRAGAQTQVARGLTGTAGALAARTEQLAVDWFSRKASVVVSTLKGPETNVRWAGRRIRSIVVWAPAPSRIAASLTLFGYAGELRLGVSTDVAVIPRPEPIVDAFQREIDALHMSRLSRAPTT